MTNTPPLISVIIPIYNVEKYLPECMDSVLKQTYTNLDIILVDDESPDNCPKMCEEYAASDPRIRVIHKTNGGLADSRNAGIKIALGEYITFVDSDDWIAPDMVEYLYTNLIKYDADICCCGHYRSYANRNIVRSVGQPLVLTNIEAAISRFDGKIRSSVWGRLYKRYIFDIAMFTNVRIYEDSRSIMDFFMAANKLCFVPEPKYYYRLRKSSMTHDLGTVTAVTGSLKNIEARHKVICEKYPQIVERGEAYLYKRYLEAIYDIRSDKKTRNTPEGIEAISSIVNRIKDLTGQLLVNTYINKENRFLLRILSKNDRLFRAVQIYKAFRRKLRKQRRKKREGTDNSKNLVLFD